MENSEVFTARRDTGEKFSLSLDSASVKIPELLKEIQRSLFNQALEFRTKNTHTAATWDEFKSIIEEGGFIKCGWDGTAETEDKIKAETKATIRCIPFDGNPSGLNCIFTGNVAKYQVIFSKAY
jgi:prolyl-tRNA synthetase